MLPVVDIFAGPGGLSEGFSKAGFEILLSAEVNPVACETLTLRKFFLSFPPNLVPDEYYQTIRGEITLKELAELYPDAWNHAKNRVVKAELGTKEGNIKLYQKMNEALGKSRDFILIGGPPCQAYSLAGRSRMLGLGNVKDANEQHDKTRLQQTLSEEFYRDARHTLYKEYLKIIEIYKPSIFVMENVKGLGSAKSGSSASAGSVFDNICHGLRNPFGNSNETNKDQNERLNYKLFSLKPDGAGLYPLQEISNPADCVLKSEEFGVPQSRHRIIIIGVRSDIKKTPHSLIKAETSITVRDAIGNLPRLRSGLSKEPDSFDEWKNAILSQSKGAFTSNSSLTKSINIHLKKIKEQNIHLNRGAKFIFDEHYLNHSKSSSLEDMFMDPRLHGFIQHETRSHIRKDLLRYFYVSIFGKVNKRSPKLSEWEGNLDILKPKHTNIQSADDKLITQAHDDRFKVQVWDKPSSTIVSHISKDGHYFIHPDPAQCRSLTVREAARLQTFPDNYFFCGNRTQQYHQVGNAVPVLLAWQVAKSIKSMID